MSEPPYIPPRGSSVKLTFTGAYTPPIGSKVKLTFSTGEAPTPGDDQYLFPSTFDSSSYGSSSVNNDLSFIAPQGVSAFVSGQAMAWRFHSYVRPNGIAPPPVGNHSIINQHRNVSPSGFDALRAGTLTIINRNRHVFAGNIVPPQVPQPNIWLYTRYLSVAGFNAGLFGAVSITHERRYLLMQSGIAAPGMGNGWISEGVRILRPAGVFLDAVGRPNVGGTRYITPPGWDSAAFGERIIPEIQTIAPQGFRELWGESAIQNWLTYVKPQGFETAGQEYYRYGQADVWNQTQIISQEYDPQDGLNPPPIVGWTGVENRNKTIGAIGISSPAPGYPAINNNARVLSSPGIAAPDAESSIRRHMIAPGIRALPLEGIDAPLISNWATLHNGAKVIAPSGINGSSFGDAAFANTRRYYQRIGDIDSAEYGQAMIAYAIREISMEPRYAIQPPDVRLPEVKQHTRYITAGGDDHFRHGLPDLTIHWSIIGPKWAHRDFVGFPELRNLTPELGAFGWNAEEFGTQFVRHQFRELKAQGSVMEQFGRAEIADTRRTIGVSGFDAGSVSRLATVVRTGAPPYSQQNITLNGPIKENAEFGRPRLNQSVVYPDGIGLQPVGNASVRLMGANIYAGIRDDAYGIPSLQLKDRVITVEETPDVFEPSAPRMSPHTIWAVKEAPKQAKDNHPLFDLHYVGETLVYPPGERFGSHRISTYLGRLAAGTLGNTARYGDANIFNARSYIEPRGLQAYRFGWATIGDGTQELRHFGGTDTMELGKPSIAAGEYFGPREIKLAGVAAPEVSQSHWISLQHRELNMSGFSALQMGSSRGDTPYQWRTLHVGPPMPTIPQGFDAQAFGTSVIGYRIRHVYPEGFDAFLCEYDPSMFAARMRVRNAEQPSLPSRTLGPASIAPPLAGTPDAKPGIHYIKPDGDSDQFRKGVPNA